MLTAGLAAVRPAVRAGRAVICALVLSGSRGLPLTVRRTPGLAVARRGMIAMAWAAARRMTIGCAIGTRISTAIISAASFSVAVGAARLAVARRGAIAMAGAAARRVTILTAIRVAIGATVAATIVVTARRTMCGSLTARCRLVT